MKELKIFPPSFTKPNDERLVVVEQVHHEQLSDSVKQHWASLSIQQEGENVVIPIITTSGGKTANSRLTLGIEDARRLIQFLDAAVRDAEKYVAGSK